MIIKNLKSENESNQNQNVEKFSVTREKDESDIPFENSADIKILTNMKIDEYFADVKKQLKIIFIMNVFFSSIAGLAMGVGFYYAIILNKIEAGVFISLCSIIAEFLANIFIKQYKDTFKSVSEEYYRFILLNNMNEALNLAKKLPLVDMRGIELRYLEIREILRAIMKNFNEHIDPKRK